MQGIVDSVMTPENVDLTRAEVLQKCGTLAIKGLETVPSEKLAAIDARQKQPLPPTVIP